MNKVIFEDLERTARCSKCGKRATIRVFAESEDDSAVTHLFCDKCCKKFMRTFMKEF